MPATVFDKPIFPGAKQILCQLTVTNTSGSYSHTEQDERITSAMSATRIEVTDPSVFRDRISITTANGSYTISCAEVSGETAVKISFLKIVDDQQFVTSTEFDTLDNRIGDLDDLETTDQTSMVDAVNEVVGSVSSNTQAIANLIEYGSNSNGEYWKYSNGMLVCSKRVMQAVSTWTAWGTEYESESISLGSHPYEFKSGTTPKVQATLTNSSASGWVANLVGLTNALVGAIKVVRPNNPGATTFGIDILAIGFWK